MARLARLGYTGFRHSEPCFWTRPIWLYSPELPKRPKSSHVQRVLKAPTDRLNLMTLSTLKGRHPLLASQRCELCC